MKIKYKIKGSAIFSEFREIEIQNDLTSEQIIEQININANKLLGVNNVREPSKIIWHQVNQILENAA